MDDPTIIKLFENQDKRFSERMDKLEDNMKEFTKGATSLMKANLINELDPIRHDLAETVRTNKIRNHRIEKAEECMNDLDKRTKLGQWVQKRPLAAAIILLAFVMIGAFAYHNVNFRDTLENKTGVVLEEPAEEDQ